MQKRVYKKGFTIIEIIATMVILSIIIFGIYSFLTIHNTVVVKNNHFLTEQVTINEAYNLFDEDPNNFMKNMNLYFDGKWVNDTYRFYNFEHLEFKINETNEYITVIVMNNEREVELWQRKKVDL